MILPWWLHQPYTTHRRRRRSEEEEGFLGQLRGLFTPAAVAACRHLRPFGQWDTHAHTYIIMPRWPPHAHMYAHTPPLTSESVFTRSLKNSWTRLFSSTGPPVIEGEREGELTEDRLKNLPRFLLDFIFWFLSILPFFHVICLLYHKSGVKATFTSYFSSSPLPSPSFFLPSIWRWGGQQWDAAPSFPLPTHLHICECPSVCSFFSLTAPLLGLFHL